MIMLMENDMKSGSCRSFREAKRKARKRKGRCVVISYSKCPLPKSAVVSYGAPECVKKEIMREAYITENNKGYHIAHKQRRCD